MNNNAHYTHEVGVSLVEFYKSLQWEGNVCFLYFLFQKYVKIKILPGDKLAPFGILH